MMYGNHDMGNWGWFGMFLMLLITVVLIALLVQSIAGVRIRDSEPRVPNASTGDQSLSILRERYAKGELTAEEYQQARDMLNDSKS